MFVVRADADDAWCQRLRGPVAARLLELGLPGLTVNVKDAAVRESMMTLSVLDPPATAVVSIWTQQSYGPQVSAVVDILAADALDVFAYLVTESTRWFRRSANRARAQRDWRTSRCFAVPRPWTRPPGGTAGMWTTPRWRSTPRPPSVMCRTRWCGR